MEATRIPVKYAHLSNMYLQSLPLIIRCTELVLKTKIKTIEAHLIWSLKSNPQTEVYKKKYLQYYAYDCDLYIDAVKNH